MRMLVLLVLRLFGAPTGAPIESTTIDLQWTAPDQCPNERAVADALHGALPQSHAPVEVRGRVTQERRRYALELSIRAGDVEGVRHLETSDCASLPEVVGGIVAAALDVRELLEDPPVPAPAEPAVGEDSNRETERDAPVQASEAPKGEREPSRSRTQRHRGRQLAPPGVVRAAKANPWAPRVELRPSAGLGLRMLPRPTAVLGLELELAWRWFRLGWGGSAWLPSEARSPGTGVGGRFVLWAVGVRGCPAVASRYVTVLPTCLGLHLGALHGRGRGLPEPQASHALWGSLTAGAGLGVHPPSRRVSTWVQGDAVLALTRPAFGTAQRSFVFRTPVVGGQVLVGVSLRLR